MYTLGSLILMAILLGAVMPVFNTLTHTLKLDKIIKSIPVLGAHVTLAVSIALVWALNVHIVSGWVGDMRNTWMTICVDGAIVYGMVPVKDAIVSFISRGLTGLRPVSLSHGRTSGSTPPTGRPRWGCARQWGARCG